MRILTEPKKNLCQQNKDKTNCVEPQSIHVLHYSIYKNIILPIYLLTLVHKKDANIDSQV